MLLMLDGSSADNLVARLADRWLQENINDFRFRIGVDIIKVRCCSRFFTLPALCHLFAGLAHAASVMTSLSMHCCARCS